MAPLVQATLMRDAADVKRYHTRRTIREQTVGAHSFNMMMLVQQLVPTCRKGVFLAIMHHDLPEYFTGDIPAPIKWFSAELAVVLENLESDLAPLHQDFGLTPAEERIVKWADGMELVLWCMEEMSMGNTQVRSMVETLLFKLLEKAALPKHPIPLWEFTSDVAVRARKDFGIEPQLSIKEHTPS